MKTIKKLFACLAAVIVCTTIFTFSACSDDVDSSNLYTFKGDMITGYLQKSDSFQLYSYVLRKVKLSSKSSSTFSDLLSARGNYTVFAPTNAAVQHYLDSIFATPNYDINQTPDSVAQDIVFNSIIDTESSEAYKTTTFQEGTFDYKTMADRFATVSFGTNDTTGKVRIFIDAFSEITSADNEAENGWMHGWQSKRS